MDRYEKEEFISSLKDNIYLDKIITSISFSDSYNFDIILLSHKNILNILMEYIDEVLRKEETPKTIIKISFDNSLDYFFQEIDSYHDKQNSDNLFILDFTTLNTAHSEDIQEVMLALNSARNSILEYLKTSILLILPKTLKKDFSMFAPDFYSLKKYVAKIDEPKIKESDKVVLEDINIANTKILELLNKYDTLKLETSIVGKRLHLINLLDISNYYMDSGMVKDNIKYAKEAFRVAKSISNIRPDSLEAKRDLSVSLDNVAMIYLQKGEADKALEYYQDSLKIRKNISNIRPDSLEAKRDLSVSLNNVAKIYLQKGEADKALEYYVKARKNLEGLQNYKYGDFGEIIDYLDIEIKKLKGEQL